MESGLSILKNEIIMHEKWEKKREKIKKWINVPEKWKKTVDFFFARHILY